MPVFSELYHLHCSDVLELSLLPTFRDITLQTALEYFEKCLFWIQQIQIFASLVRSMEEYLYTPNNLSHMLYSLSFMQNFKINNWIFFLACNVVDHLFVLYMCGCVKACPILFEIFVPGGGS